MKKALIYLVNVVLIALMIIRVIEIDNDKGIIIVLFYYPLLLLVNFGIGLKMRFSKNSLSRNYFEVCLCMMVLFFPILFWLAFME
jgi:hypothetical protein